MKYIDEYRSTELSRKLIDKVARISRKPAKLMEFCGGHTVAIMRSGIRQVLPEHIQMLSGPGCPVCATANEDIDHAIALTELPGAIITTFGDMMKVPGSYSSLQEARAQGKDIRIVYSLLDALQIARDNPARPVIFIGIGFETTAPTIAAGIIRAAAEKLDNFSVLCLLKKTPPVMKAICDMGQVRLDGIVCPGHVSSIIGTVPYDYIAADYGIACAVSGFETVDILYAILLLVTQIESGKPQVEIAYRRSVTREGNRKARELMERIFETSSANWRGIGRIPESGMIFKKEFGRFDARQAFSVTLIPPREPAGCICGDILRGIKTPRDCGLFRKTCRPENPVGPCMVSSEGACAAYYAYGAADE